MSRTVSRTAGGLHGTPVAGQMKSSSTHQIPGAREDQWVQQHAPRKRSPLHHPRPATPPYPSQGI